MQSRADALIAEIAAGHAPGASGADRSFLIGLIGRAIGSSRSPVMHQREGRRLGMRYTYALIDFDRGELPDTALGGVVAAAEAARFAGLNVTHPFKQAVMRHLTEVSPEAATIGAVNTVVFRAGRRIGHNTDSWGFAESFRLAMAGCDLRSVALFGAGGGGAAVAHALLELGVDELGIFDPDIGRAAELAASLARRFGRTVVPVEAPEAAVRGAAGVVNATPIGMSKYPGAPFALEVLTPGHWVADIVYFPPDTALLRHARELGCRTLAGTGMAVFQAVKAFELFTGVAPDREQMTRHFEAAA